MAESALSRRTRKSSKLSRSPWSSMVVKKFCPLAMRVSVPPSRRSAAVCATEFLISTKSASTCTNFLTYFSSESVSPAGRLIRKKEEKEEKKGMNKGAAQRKKRGKSIYNGFECTSVGGCGKQWRASASFEGRGNVFFLFLFLLFSTVQRKTQLTLSFSSRLCESPCCPVQSLLLERRMGFKKR